MSPSTASAGPTADQNSRQGLHALDGKAYHSARDVNSPEAEVGPCPRYLAMGELARLIEEPPGGDNHGWKATTAPEDSLRSVRAGQVPLGAGDAQHFQFLRDGGWSIVHTRDGSRAGINSHGVNQYTVLHPEDYVDSETLIELLEAELGFTLEELHSVYSTGGRIPAERVELRQRIDARLLALADAGANMDLFGRVTGLNGSTVDRALGRARAAG